MRPIIIGAGRGSRLEHLTEEIPKTLVPVMGRPILEWVLEALAEGGFVRKDVVFICGYRAEVIKAQYPEFTYVENRDWENNNILLSLMTARQHLKDGFVSSYADIIYRGAIVSDLVASPHSKVLGCDTDWRRRYVGRTRHPETDAEKMRAEGQRIIELSRTIASEHAAGEFIGVAKFDREGAAELCDAFDRARARFAGQVFREKRTFERAYLIDLFQDMIEKGSVFHRVDTHGGYMEIDTLQDESFAASWWHPKS
jgi:L-glutamine-phosphate cytidylyltransferase